MERVYENALKIELENLGLRVKQQEPIKVRDEGRIVGHNCADLWVNDCIVIELKAVQTLVKRYDVQLVNYLAATAIDTVSCSTLELQ